MRQELHGELHARPRRSRVRRDSARWSSACCPSCCCFLVAIGLRRGRHFALILGIVVNAGTIVLAFIVLGHRRHLLRRELGPRARPVRRARALAARRAPRAHRLDRAAARHPAAFPDPCTAQRGRAVRLHRGDLIRRPRDRLPRRGPGLPHRVRAQRVDRRRLRLHRPALRAHRLRRRPGHGHLSDHPDRDRAVPVGRAGVLARSSRSPPCSCTERP